MDTIKFRYIFKDKKGKIYKEIFSLVDIERGDIDNALMGFDHDDIEIEIIAKDRFTGLYDKNKKEIYGGDIVDGRGWENEYIRFKEPVIWEHTGWYIGWKNKKFHDITSLDACKDLKIIGNIYENQKLLKK